MLKKFKEKLMLDKKKTQTNRTDETQCEKNEFDSHLLDAVKKNDFRDVEWFLKQKANPNTKDSFQNTSLHLSLDAKLKIHPRIVERLLFEDADVNAINSEGDTPLHKAVHSSIERVQLLLDRKVDVNACNTQNGRTPLYTAVARKDIKMMELLLKAGASVDIRDKAGITLLEHAIKTKKPNVAKCLQGYDLKIKTEDPKLNTALLVYCIKEKKLEMVQLLLKNGIDPNHPYSDPDFPHRKNTIPFLILVQQMLDGIEKRKNDWRYEDDFGIQLDIAVLLLKQGADVNARNTENENALIMVARCELKAAAELNKLSRFLIDSGIDINARDKQFYSAFKTKNEELTKMLLKKETQNNVNSARRAFLSGGLEENGLPKYSNSPLYFFFNHDTGHEITETILAKANLLPSNYRKGKKS